MIHQRTRWRGIQLDNRATEHTISRHVRYGEVNKSSIAANGSAPRGVSDQRWIWSGLTDPSKESRRWTCRGESASSVTQGSGNARTQTVTVVLTNSGTQNAVGVSVNATVSNGTVTGGPHAISIAAGRESSVTFTWYTNPGNGQSFSVTLPASTAEWIYVPATVSGINGNNPFNYNAPGV